MANPLIVYDRPLLNPSFETGTVGSLPTSWLGAGSGTGIREISTTDYYHRGSNEGTRSLKLRADTLDYGVYQRVLNWYRLNETVRLMVWARNLDSGSGSLQIAICDDDAGLAQVGASTLTVSIPSAWTLLVLERTQDQPTAVHTRIFMRDLNHTGKNMLVDYVQFGRRVDFDRNFIRFRAHEEARRQLSLGGGAYEASELGDPVTAIDGEYGSVEEGSAVDLQLHAFRGWARAHRPFGFWLDRDTAKNQDLHFGECISGVEFPRDLEPGPRRYKWNFEATAPKEWIAQAA